MRLKRVSFRNVGPFGARGVSLQGFTPGLNVVCETNEFGKSTVLKSLELVLFKPFSSADKQIKSLRTANSEEAPEGEIVFSSEGRDYRFSKRFLKSKGARLQDDITGEVLGIDRAAEVALAKLLCSDRFEGGPSGLLWVRQGKSMEGITDNGQIASRLEGELGTLIGGERARDYLARVETELAAVLTPSGQEKKSGPLRLAREAVEAIQAELLEAKRLRDLTRSIGIELGQVTREIDRVSREAEDDTISKQIETTRGAMERARSFANALALLEAQSAQALSTAERAAAGLFLAMQHPTEVPGVLLRDVLDASSALDDAGFAALVGEELSAIGLDPAFLERPLNVDLSGGEKKRNETIQLAVLKPQFAILDEIDSGLDVDGLRLVSKRIERATNEDGLGVLAITHFTRLLTELRADKVHIFTDGKIVETGGPELADELEESGYGRWVKEASPTSNPAVADDPFADPFA